MFSNIDTTTAIACIISAIIIFIVSLIWVGRKTNSTNTSLKIKKIAYIGIIAAIYAVMTWTVAPISYGAVQFRISEVLVLLAFVDKLYIPGLFMGCVIANIASPFGLVDVIIGSFATLISVYMINKSKNLFVASLWPSIFNAILIGAELYIAFNLPFLETAAWIAFGEFVVVTCAGYPLFKYGIFKNKRLISILKISE
ncbi:QueT transporter family protein [Clostridium sediminicola]|uniref:QueT transporter family protein n=1 Tax=Clostridium sediminicola TaxID=3114879 RepID=UPI0031F27A62